MSKLRKEVELPSWYKPTITVLGTLTVITGILAAYFIIQWGQAMQAEKKPRPDPWAKTTACVVVYRLPGDSEEDMAIVVLKNAPPSTPTMFVAEVEDVELANDAQGIESMKFLKENLRRDVD